jgi:methionine salvage enolase-phosphatase E1
MVKTHIQGDIWSNGWRVDEVGARVPEDYVSRHERDHLTQARASDAVRDPDGNGK